MSPPPPPSYHSYNDADDDEKTPPPSYAPSEPPNYTSRPPSLCPPSLCPSLSANTYYQRNERENEPLLPTSRNPPGRNANRWRTTATRVKITVRGRERRGLRNQCQFLLWLAMRVVVLVGVFWVGAGLWKGGRWWKGPRTVVDVRVGVVGAGPAGIAAAYSLSQQTLQPHQRLSITVFEQSPQIGGRMAISPPVEAHQAFHNIALEEVATNSLFRPKSLFAKRASEVLGIDKEDEEPGQDVGFWDQQAKKMVAIFTRPYSELSWIKYLGLVWRYGASIWRARSLPQTTILPTLDILGREALDLQGLLRLTNWKSLAATSAKDAVQKAGISEKYATEILNPQLHRQLGGQGIADLNALALSRALQAEDRPPARKSFAFNGNTMKTFEVLIEKSKASLRLNTKVTGFKQEIIEEGGTRMWLLETSQAGETSYETFDHLIQTGPQNTTSFQRRLSYQPIWATFVIARDRLNGSIAGGKQSDNIPDEILPIHDEEGVLSISLLRGLWLSGKDDYLYRILSLGPLGDSTLGLFGFDEDRDSLVFAQEIPNAYPVLSSLSWSDVGDEELSFEAKKGDGLWYAGAWDGLVGSEVSDAWWVGENLGLVVGEQIVTEA